MSVTLLERARNYVSKLPAAVSGQNGHGATFHAEALRSLSSDEKGDLNSLSLGEAIRPKRRGNPNHGKLASLYKREALTPGVTLQIEDQLGGS